MSAHFKTVMLTPTADEKSEWSRMARAAYRENRNDIGHRFSGAAALPHDGALPIRTFDSLQTDYRAWLMWNEFAPLA